jgi:hypothetical protein
VLALAIAFERFEPIARRNSRVMACPIAHAAASAYLAIRR